MNNNISEDIKDTTEDIITKEIATHGNTNRIANSGLPNGAQIFAVGDSHTIFFYNSMRIKEHWAFMGRIPMTMYTLLRDGMNIYEIGKSLGGGHENYEVKAGDFVLFFYGFNDIQKNIHVYGGKEWRYEIMRLLSEYIELMVMYRKKYSITPIVTCIYPNPLPEAEGQNPNGTYQERMMYTKYANQLLELMCRQWSLPFYDIYDLITDENGFIKRQVTKDFIHLDYNNSEIREKIEKYILDLCLSCL